MTTKLTLTIEQSVIEKAKSYARSRRSSLSAVIENYLKAITENTNDSKGLSATLKSSKGAFKMPENFDYKKEHASRLSEKYL